MVAIVHDKSLIQYTNVLLYDRNIIGSSSAIIGYLRKYEYVCLAFGQFLENLRKYSEIVPKSSENRQKRRH